MLLMSYLYGVLEDRTYVLIVEPPILPYYTLNPNQPQNQFGP